VLAFVLALWGICGIGPVVLAAPKTRFLSWILLAPLIGYMLIAAIGVARLEFFLAPANPQVDCGALAIASLVMLYLRRKTVQRRWRRCSWFLLRLSPPYFAFFFLYVFVFGTSGFETLSTGSDEIAHGLIENQIIQNVHRGTPNDNPIMRLDHYVQDYPAKDLAYLKNSRKGSDMLTIATAMILHMSPERVYPVTFGSLTLVVAAAALFLCRNGFNMSFRWCWPAPLFFLASSGLWRLHVEGNFSNLSSWPMFLLAPWFLIQALGRVRMRWLFPLALIVASVYSFYFEPATLFLLFPCFLTILYCIWRRKTTPVKVLAAAAIICPLLILLNPTFVHKFVFASTIARYTAAGALTSQIPSAGGQPFDWAGLVLSGLRRISESDWWGHAAHVLFGGGPAVPFGEFHEWLLAAASVFPKPSLLGGFVMIALASYGLLAGRDVVGVLATIMMFTWLGVATVSILVVSNVSFFTFYRSMMYVLPFLLLGVGLAFCRGSAVFMRSAKFSRYWAALPVSASIGFLFMNSFSSAAVGAYVHSHTTCEDPWIRRLNPDAPIWQDLRATLSESPMPVLISGFSDPPRVLWLASSIRPLAHFMGKSTSDRWLFGVHAVPDAPFYRNLTPPNEWTNRWYSRLSGDEILKLSAREDITWNEIYPRFLSQSEIGIVPVRHGWPVEWEQRADILGPLTIEYPNIADVVYRRRAALSLEGGGLGPLTSDNQGPYRGLSGDTVITAHPRLGWAEASIRYDGMPGDLKVPEQSLLQFREERNENRTTLYIRYRAPVQSVTIPLTGRPGLRVRNVSMRVTPAALGCGPGGTEP
jgi:hypothetical protein